MLNQKEIERAFESQINSKLVQLYFLENARGFKVGICNYGARITHFIIPQKGQTTIDIILGFNSIEGYLKASERYHGVTVGPFANRINNASFYLGGVKYNLEANNGANCLHGGSNGFHDEVWDIIAVHPQSITLCLTQPNLKGGFPGELKTQVTFSLNNENELKIDYVAISDLDTVINLTNHAYFNLNGEENGNILQHLVKINAKRYVEIDEACIPSGKLLNVTDGPFDFTDFKPIGKDIETQNQQLEMGAGYDHSFELYKKENEFTFAAAAKGDLTPITLEVYTTEPALQFYTGNFLDGKDQGKSGAFYKPRSGFCFETQHHPDSPNQANFHSTILKKDEEFKTTTVYKISNF